MRRLTDAVMNAATACDIAVIGDRWRAITLTGPDITGLHVTAGQHARIQVGAANPLLDRLVGALRTYSIWHYDGQYLHLRVFDHGDGPGAAWARTALPGDEVRLLRPQGDFVCRPSAYHLFAGEETAAVAFGAMIRDLDDTAVVHAVIEVDTEREQLPIPGNVAWVHRGGRTAARSTELVAAVAGLDLPAAPGTAYLAGEAGTIQLLRDHLVRERGWNRRDVVTKPFWTPGKTGME